MRFMHKILCPVTHSKLIWGEIIRFTNPVWMIFWNRIESVTVVPKFNESFRAGLLNISRRLKNLHTLKCFNTVLILYCYCWEALSCCTLETTLCSETMFLTKYLIQFTEQVWKISLTNRIESNQLQRFWHKSHNEEFADSLLLRCT